MKLPPQLENLRKIKYNMPIGVVVALGLNILYTVALFITVSADQVNALMYYMVLLLIIGNTFIIFYLFGIRELKWMIAFGLVIFLILGGVYTYLYVEEIYSEEVLFSADEMTLTNGTVTPYFSTETGQVFNFTVTYTGNLSANDTDLRVKIFGLAYSDTNMTLNMTVDPQDNDTATGATFYATTGLDEGEIYSFYFVVKQGEHWDWENNSGNESDDIFTNENYGPLTKEKGGVFSAILPMGMIVNGVCNMGMLFFIVVLLYWWMGKAKAQRREWEATKEEAASPKKEPVPFESEKKEKKKKSADFSCTSCGGDAWDEDEKCSHCGESFDDDIEEPEEAAEDRGPADFSCTSCGGDAWEEDDKCRKCGEPFDDGETGDAEEVPEKTDGFAFCPFCGKELEKQYYFCPHCGKPLEEHDE